LTPIINIDPDPDVADAPAVVVENVTEPTDVAIADKPVDIADTLNTNRNSTGPTDAAPSVVTDPTDAAPTPVSAIDAPTVLVEPVFPVVEQGSKTKQKPFLERLEVQVAFPVAAVVLAGGIIAAYMSGLCGGAGGRTLATGDASSADAQRTSDGRDGGVDAGAADATMGTSTAISTRGTGNLVRRTSTSTAIDLSG
jgi:hypothetical protein